MVAAFKPFSSRVVPLVIDHIDTDQIIPARFLKVVDKAGLGEALFADWRQAPDFILNQPESEGAAILLAGANFGCGSSREHAPWALLAHGFKAVVALSFGDIFQANALKNGVLPIAVPAAVHQAIVADRRANPTMSLSVDLEHQRLSHPSGETCVFPIDGFAKHCLLNGVDELEYLQSLEPHIAAFESARDTPMATPQGR